MMMRHQIVLRAVAPSADSHPTAILKFSGFNITISIDAERQKLAEGIVREFRHKMHDLLANEAVCDRVLQINMQMFTIAGS